MRECSYHTITQQYRKPTFMAKQSSPAARSRPSQRTHDVGSQTEPFIDALCKGFANFVEQFAHLFQSGNHCVAETAQQYVCGLVQAEKRNMERMAEAVPESDPQVLQNFLTPSSWDYRAVMDAVAHMVRGLLIGFGAVSLNIDGSAFAKKGKKSVGVARQHNGRLGKEDNCQVGVFGALAAGARVALIAAYLFLPKEWTDDPDRCELAGVPVENRAHRTKIELAHDIIQHTEELGIRYEWIGMDSEFGHSLEFLKSLDASGKIFLADVHANRHIYLADPAPFLPPQGPGRTRVRYHSKAKPVEVSKWVKQQPESRWKKLTLRESTRGNLSVEILHQRVWLWDKHSETAHCWHLIVRREIQARDTIKYSVSNAPAGTGLAKLAQMQAQRFWIERAFQDAKSHLGMAQYQARKWDSWHRHMALVMLAALFMLQMRIEHVETRPLLSCYDIQVLLAKSLPDRRSDPEELMRQMARRHQQRDEAINRYSG
jgi:SRSO17 transposase